MNHPMIDSILSTRGAYEAGRLARRDGKHYDVNPFAPKSSGWCRWRVGYCDEIDVRPPKVFDEFKDYPRLELPAIPEGFVDTSWRKDACPSFTNPALALKLWTDYPAASLREMPDQERFTLETLDANGDANGNVVVHTEDWGLVLLAIAKAREVAAG